MDIQETGKLKKVSKRNNKKNINKDIKFDLDYYEYQKNLDNTNPFNLEFLSLKEKTDFENKFSKPRNDSQWKLLNSLKKKDLKIVIASGPAGTGKTLFGIEQGIKNYLNGTYEKLIFTRPVVTVDEDIGYLPGTLEDKLGPYIRPIYDI